MNKFTVGLIGTIAIVVAMVIAMQFGRLPFVEGGRHVSAYFTEAGGLRKGSPVLVSGAKVGEVKSIVIEGDRVRVDATLTNHEVRLGRTTTAAISTLTLLGKAGLELQPRGTGDLQQGAKIPVSRTSSPYDITEALAELTTRSASIDVDQLSKALSTTSQTLSSTPVDLDEALEGVTDVSRTISENGDTVESLLDKTRDLTDTLQSRNERVADLLKSGSDLLDELTDRQELVVDLLAGVTRLTAELSRLIEENRTDLEPALAKLNAVTALLNRNKANLEKTIVGARDYVVEFNDLLSSGPFVDAYVQNLTSPGTLAPYLSGALQ